MFMLNSFFVVVWLLFCLLLFYPLADCVCFFRNPIKPFMACYFSKPQQLRQALLQIVRIINTAHWECSEIGERSCTHKKVGENTMWIKKKGGEPRKVLLRENLNVFFSFWYGPESFSGLVVEWLGNYHFSSFWLFAQFELLIKQENNTVVMS